MKRSVSLPNDDVAFLDQVAIDRSLDSRSAAPITGNTARVWPFQVFLPVGDSPLDRDSTVQAEQVRAVAAARFVRSLGSLGEPVMAKVDDALRLHLFLGSRASATIDGCPQQRRP